MTAFSVLAPIEDIDFSPLIDEEFDAFDTKPLDGEAITTCCNKYVWDYYYSSGD